MIQLLALRRSRLPILTTFLLITLSLSQLLAEDTTHEYNLANLPKPLNQKIDFATQVLPLFQTYCQKCHGPKKQKGGLRLDIKSDAFAGGDSGKILQIGKPQHSLLLHRITTNDEDEIMPPKGKPLNADQIAIITTWIKQGANWPDNLAGNTSKKSDHWAFQPITNPKPPTPKSNYPRHNPIDAFVQAKLKQRNITPSPIASRSTLIKRLYYLYISLFNFVLKHG